MIYYTDVHSIAIIIFIDNVDVESSQSKQYTIAIEWGRGELCSSRICCIIPIRSS